MIRAKWVSHTLNFKFLAGTSRGVLTQKPTWYLILQTHTKFGIGECSYLDGLSIDPIANYETTLQWVCDNINKPKTELLEALIPYPSIRFGVEMALQALNAKTPYELFPSAFTRGEHSIPINGLIWMGNPDFMRTQIKTKIKEGFNTLKLKVGALDFDSEIEILKGIRQTFSDQDLNLRLDANGAFSPNNVKEKLERLAVFNIHSIEQPLAPKQFEAMQDLIQKTPIPIALDEELIGVNSTQDKLSLITTLKPHYLILKPSLLGGFVATQEWINLAVTHNIDWWITSALESNIGLNAIAQYTYKSQNTLLQGLGTGNLFHNNIESPLEVTQGFLRYNTLKNWKLNPYISLKK